jgi:alpha-glucosidase
MPGWWEHAVVYEIYPRSFQDSDGDGVGDLDGIAGRLPYLRDLGVDAIWLTPIYPSPGADCGYDVSDHGAVAPEFGGDEAFDRLVATAHEMGIRVMLDLVVSHTSIEHPWFSEHPDWYVWRDGDAPPNSWLASFGGPAWSRLGDRWYLHSFFPEQPDLDWANPEVRAAMGDMIRGWVERGVDGFRVDAVDRLGKDPGLRDDPQAVEPFPLPVAPGQELLDLVHSRDGAEIAVALETLREAAGDVPLIGEVYLPGPRLGPYLPYFDRVFAFDLLHAEWEPTAIAAVIERIAGPEGDALALVTSNHDFSRVATRWGPEAVRNAALLLLALPGPAFVYQGEELGMEDGPGGSPPVDRFGRDSFRHPMPWADGHAGGFSGGEPWLPATGAPGGSAESQAADPSSVLSLFKRLIAARGELAGGVSNVTERDGLLGFERGSGHVVLLNLSGEPRQDERLVDRVTLVESAPGVVSGGELAPHAGAVMAP